MTTALQHAPETMLAQSHFARGIVQSLLRGADGEDDVTGGEVPLRIEVGRGR